MSCIVFVVATLALSLALGGCSSSPSATRDKPTDGDRGTRTIGSKIDNSLIETEAAVNIVRADPALDKDFCIVVASYNGTVLIAGQAPRAGLKSKAEQAARTVQRVKNAHNELQMTSPSSLFARNNDAWITTKPKIQMLSDLNVPPSWIKVVIENGIVYIMGLVNQQEAAQAVRVVRGVDGVQKIVKLFEYTN